MIITIEIAEKVRVKRAKLAMTKTALSKRLGIARQTLVKIEKGQYRCPKRIYESVMTWLVEEI
mgnify:CR=1 FL=1